MKIVNDHLATKALMLPPTDNGFLLLAAEVGWRGPFRRPRPAVRQLLAHAKAWCVDAVTHPDILEATTFRAVLVAPGEGSRLIKARAGAIHHARYDVVVLIRTTSVQAAKDLRDHPDYQALAGAVGAAARHTMQVVAGNAARLGRVDHRPDHVYLFNYFYADDNAVLLPVFRYTAGWFQANTGLPNSELMQPLDGEQTDNGIINHASWPGFRTFLPSLLFKPSYRRFVLATFKANNVAPQPILYRRI